jgi:nitrate/TMAO reductase-like tetraheme cytochrome c subunit
MHSKSTIYKDPIHKAVWESSPAFKKGNYVCGRCHTPADSNMIKKLNNNLSVMPNQNNKAQNDGISCAYCHRIKNIKYGDRQNINIVNEEQKLYYGNLVQPKQNNFHKSSTNKLFQTGNICIGCHSHFKNKYGVNVCSTNQSSELNSANCVSCHMPKVAGSPSSLYDRDRHTFHGFAGIHNDMTMLKEHIDIGLLQGEDRFFISIDSKTPHTLTLHPLRSMKLKVSIIRGSTIIDCIEHSFKRVVGTDNNETLPWYATKIVENTSIKANEKRILTYFDKLYPGDRVMVKVGYYLITENSAKMLNLNSIKELREFKLLKSRVFHIKGLNYQ